MKHLKLATIRLIIPLTFKKVLEEALRCGVIRLTSTLKGKNLSSHTLQTMTSANWSQNFRWQLEKIQPMKFL